MSKIGNFIVWAEENGWIDYNPYGEQVWVENAEGDAYQAYHEYLAKRKEQTDE